MKYRNVLAMCLVALMALAILSVGLPARVQASYLDYLTFDLCVDGLTVISCDKGISGALALPANLYLRGDPTPIPVVEIGNSVFEDCTGLTSISFGDNMKRIGDWAFWGCTGVTSVTIPASVNDIGTLAFGGCKQLQQFNVAQNNPYYSSDSRGVLFDKAKTRLIQAPARISGSYEIPESVRTFEGSAFSNCTALTSLTVPEGVSTLDFYLFNNCSGLTEVHLPSTLTLIDEGAFSGCTALKTVYFNGTLAQWNRITKRYDNDALKNARIVFPVQAGDLDSNGSVDEDDAIYLLQHVMMPSLFEISQNADIDKNGEVDEDDAIYLLQHIMMPEFFPLG